MTYKITIRNIMIHLIRTFQSRANQIKLGVLMLVLLAIKKALFFIKVSIQ